MRPYFLFLILINLNVLPHALAAAPNCFGNALQDITSDEHPGFGPLSRRLLPEKISFYPTRREFKDMSTLAKRAYAKEKKIAELIATVNKVAEGKVAPADLEQILNASPGRAVGNLSRDHKLRFDPSHIALKRLEQLKSTIRANSDPKTMVAAAQELRKNFDELPVAADLNDIGSGILSSYSDSVNKLVVRVEDLLRPPMLNEADHRELVDGVRRFETYYAMRNALDPSRENSFVLTYLKALSTRMSEGHDRAILSAFDAAAPASPALRQLPFADRKRVREFINRVEIDSTDGL